MNALAGATVVVGCDSLLCDLIDMSHDRPALGTGIPSRKGLYLNLSDSMADERGASSSFPPC
jgi:hypothetical protein